MWSDDENVVWHSTSELHATSVRGNRSPRWKSGLEPALVRHESTGFSTRQSRPLLKKQTQRLISGIKSSIRSWAHEAQIINPAPPRANAVKI
ncbi:hypothetical protein AVEN_117622-1 [Araneus ventricosus]|uniref:Uncharacterized protein n=1 Tax=Araneus ventricosus TaxID=182803 RepID=A0A4Y2KFG1_ARAVE|nr:hypothetical protein AVEN_117622-1 [Araneus ventricosus]